MGVGQVYDKYRSVTMRGRDYVAPNVPWAMWITQNGMICMHWAPWQEQANEAFGVHRSHGCIRIPSPHARWLFENTPKGAPVTIQA